MFEGQHCDYQLLHPQYLPVIVTNLFMNSKFRTSGMTDDVSAFTMSVTVNGVVSVLRVSVNVFSVLLQWMASCQ